jgi:hypothetical protein
MSPGEEWIEIQETAAIISENSGRKISPDYVRLLAYKGRIQWKPKDGRTLLYLKSDAQKIRVKTRKKQNTEPQQQDGDSEEVA